MSNVIYKIIITIEHRKYPPRTAKVFKCDPLKILKFKQWKTNEELQSSNKDLN